MRPLATAWTHRPHARPTVAADPALDLPAARTTPPPAGSGDGLPALHAAGPADAGRSPGGPRALDAGRPLGAVRPLEAGGPVAAVRARGRGRAVLALLGPAFVAAVAYVDPGNFATNFSAGAQFGYALAWVVVLANLMA